MYSNVITNDVICAPFVTTFLKRSGEAKIDIALVHLCDFRHCVPALLDSNIAGPDQTPHIKLCDKHWYCLYEGWSKSMWNIFITFLLIWLLGLFFHKWNIVFWHIFYIILRTNYTDANLTVVMEMFISYVRLCYLEDCGVKGVEKCVSCKGEYIEKMWFLDVLDTLCRCHILGLKKRSVFLFL